jgi:hypothetical protein
MPTVRFLTAVAGDRFHYYAGQVVELPGEEASKWCDGVRAEIVRTPVTETTDTGSHRTRSRTRRV